MCCHCRLLQDEGVFPNSLCCSPISLFVACGPQADRTRPPRKATNHSSTCDRDDFPVPCRAAGRSNGLSKRTLTASRTGFTHTHKAQRQPNLKLGQIPGQVAILGFQLRDHVDAVWVHRIWVGQLARLTHFIHHGLHLEANGAAAHPKGGAISIKPIIRTVLQPQTTPAGVVGELVGWWVGVWSVGWLVG